MLATTHVIIPIVIADLLRDYFLKHKHRRLIPRRYIFFVGVGGLLPDIDIAIGYLLRFLLIDVPWWLKHHGVTHSIFFPIIMFTIAAMLWKYTKFSKGPSKKKHNHWFLVTTMLAIGIVAHLLLDGLAGDTTPFIPLSRAAAFGAQRIYLQHMISIDAVILLAWLFHEEGHHNIRKFF
jgi:membrane-bound metal-dependent hydrolase YbcI (DUF457 family)